MIIDAKALPVYATNLGKQNVIRDELVVDWKRLELNHQV